MCTIIHAARWLTLKWIWLHLDRQHSLEKNSDVSYSILSSWTLVLLNINIIVDKRIIKYGLKFYNT